PEPGRDRSRLRSDSDLVEENRMPREILPRSLDVHMDLMVQLERRAELLFAPQKMMEVEPDHIAVDVGIEVEDVALDGQRVILVQRRADSDVRHALERAREAFEARGCRVDASARMQLVGRLDVHSRKS